MLWEVAERASGKRVRRAVYRSERVASRRAQQLGAGFLVRPSALPDGYKAILARMKLVECPKQPGYR